VTNGKKTKTIEEAKEWAKNLIIGNPPFSSNQEKGEGVFVILKDGFKVELGPDDPLYQAVIERAEEERDDVLVGIPTKAKNYLAKVGIRTRKDLEGKSISNLLDIPGVNTTTLAHLEKAKLYKGVPIKG